MDYSMYGTEDYLPLTPPETANSTPLLPFLKPRKTPQIDIIPLLPDPLDDPIPRSPTTPPLLNPPQAIQPVHRPRSRSCTAPPLNRRSTYPTYSAPSSTITPASVFGLCPPSPQLTAQGLGLRVDPCVNHHGDRIREILSGDGEYDIDDAISPDYLPEQAKPHLAMHRRHFSTSSLPHLFDQRDTYHPVQPLIVEDNDQPPNNTSTNTFRPHVSSMSWQESEDTVPTTIPRRSSHDFRCTVTPHSPLSTYEPLTPHYETLKRQLRSNEWDDDPMSSDSTEHIEDIEME